MELYEKIYTAKFSFGKNWEKFLQKLNRQKIDAAKQSLLSFTHLKSFKNKTFIDVGSGSGLFSLCAILLGAKKVISIDVDKNCINCAKYLRKKFFVNEKKWQITYASALDVDFLKTLPKGDIVYSWGVLHHTGDMWKALENVTTILKKDSLLYLAIYNHYKGFPSSANWQKIKKVYANSNSLIRTIFNLLFATQILFFRLIRLQNPISYVKNYENNNNRGQSFFTDLVDWLGGYPYDYASAKKIIDFYTDKGLKLKNLNEKNGTGCNEFLFVK